MFETKAQHACFGGTQGVYAHDSDATGTRMEVAVYVPPAAADGPCPVLYYLSGLTCTWENVATKAGAQRYCAEQGIVFVAPDTSPRGEGVPDDEAYDLGQGAGFYIDATQPPWDTHFKMWTYVAEELPALIGDRFAIDMDRQAITGHSMGGHGALTLAMGLPGRFASVSAFAPICHPSRSDWGRKQLTAYLGPEEAGWAAHDAAILMRERGFDGPVLTDTGTADPFIDLLMPEELAAAAAARRQPGAFRMQAGYDHSYFFVASFIADHVAFHAGALAR